MGLTSGKYHIYWTLLGAPVIQEVIFRFLPFQFFYLPGENFWQIGIITSLLFASIHYYFGKWFTVGSFFAGVFYWFLMVNFGLLAAILGHTSVNAMLLKLKLL